MRRATPSMHCSFSPSRSFSFFLPSRMTANEKIERKKNIMRIIDGFLAWFCHGATHFSVSFPLRRNTTSCRWRARLFADTLEASTPVKSTCHHLHIPTNSLHRYLKISERAFDAVFPLILTLRLTFLLSITDRPEHRPIINLKFHGFLKRCWRWRLRRWLAACVWRWAWQLSICGGSRFIEIKWQLGTFEVAQSNVLLLVGKRNRFIIPIWLHAARLTLINGTKIWHESSSL